MGLVRLISRSFYLLTYLLTYLLIPCLHGPLRALASLIMDVHSSRSTAPCRHLLTFTSRRFFSIFSSHRNLGLPLLLLPSGSLSHFFRNCPSLLRSYYVSNTLQSRPLYYPKKTTLPSEWEVRRNPEPVWTFCRR